MTLTNLSLMGTQFQRTEEECPICEEGILLQGHYEKFCSSCWTVIDSNAFPDSDESEWEQWQKHRHEEYSGLTGQDRVKMVGGFEGPFFYTDDPYISGEL